ncbi:hypothetical protein [Sphaerochaeta pleomorpha]|uniref:hypothetical protein n=1 Tax=Sphaerochaeta pleomorpha TaxID=1131707 RepID=UPI00059D0E93|nr:hypothetical protein [Sphaerochaeta pleomorpha]
MLRNNHAWMQLLRRIAWECDRYVRGKRPSDNELRVKKHRDIATALCGRNYEALVKSLVFPFTYTYKPDSLDMEQ